MRNRKAGEDGVGCIVWSLRGCLTNYYYNYRIKDISGAGRVARTREEKDIQSFGENT